MLIRYLLSSFLLVLPISVRAQAPRILKIDPPNWYATLPAPLLLVRGENLSGTSFSLSDRRLHLERSSVSANGHWAQLWLTASPENPETVNLIAIHGKERTEASYTFSARRQATDGMAGFSPRDILYLILTDRFADGDLANDGPEGHSTGTSAEAASERSKPRGWHGGDLRGIVQHLDYLQSLGATALWPTPVYQNHAPEAYHGYHATDYYAVDEHYGSLADLKGLASALHSRRMKLVLDTVPNHVGPLHPWVADEPAPDWFHGTRAQHVEAENNFDALMNPHAPERDRIATLHGWFVNLLPDMNTENPAVAQYLRQNAIWWIEQTGADGLRIDTFPYVDREFWHAFTAELHGLYPHLTEVGEVSSRDPEITASFADGVTRSGVDTGLYTPFDFPTYHAARDVFAAGQPMTRLTRVLEADELYPHPERLVPFLGNHDESRFAQTVTDPALQRVAYTFLLTMRGTPQIYSGDELAMPGGDDPENRRDFPGGFPGDRLTAFSASGRTAAQAMLFTWIADLAKLRQTYTALSCGAQQVLFVDQDTLVYTRFGVASCELPPSGSAAVSFSVIVALHRGAASRVRVDLRNTAVSGCRPKSVGPRPSPATVVDDVLSLQLATDAAVLTCEEEGTQGTVKP